MNAGLIANAFLVVAMLITMVGCTANKPFRTGQALPVIESTDDYKLGFVEFDDQGWFWDRTQLEKVQQMIREEAGIDDPSSTPQGIILVAFVHGWKHNADATDTNVMAMREVLTQLRLSEKAQEDHAPRKVVGVYVAWRGLSETIEPLKELSFWGRKETAHEV